MDWTAFNLAVSFADPLVAVSGAAVALLGLVIAIKGARIVLGFIRG